MDGARPEEPSREEIDHSRHENNVVVGALLLYIPRYECLRLCTVVLHYSAVVNCGLLLHSNGYQTLWCKDFYPNVSRESRRVRYRQSAYGIISSRFFDEQDLRGNQGVRFLETIEVDEVLSGGVILRHDGTALCPTDGIVSGLQHSVLCTPCTALSQKPSTHCHAP